MAIPHRRILAGELLQHMSRSAYRNQPLHFGRKHENRYDAPDDTYGVLYVGLTLSTTLMESLFHEHQWHVDRGRVVSLMEVQNRLVRIVGVLEPLTLADVTAPGVMAGHFGLNLEQLSGRGYGHTQRVSAEIHAAKEIDGAATFDGVVYPSRNNFPEHALALFDRASCKIEVIQDIDLIRHRDWPDFVRDYRIAVRSGG